MIEKKKKSAPAVETITSYKGFDKDLKCRGFQYKVGETFKYDGDVKVCESGFHACEYPLDTLGHYPLAGNRFAVVEQSGELSHHDGYSNVASKSISIKEEISIAGLVKAAIEYTRSRCNPVDHGASSATGPRGASLATGPWGASLATGTGGASLATGDYGASLATGPRGASSATGLWGASSATGSWGASSATGLRGASLATGEHGASLATGPRGASLATGYHGVSLATGPRGASLATGYHGASSATGKASVAVATGLEGRAQAADGGAIVLVFRDGDENIVHIRASKVGENGIKAGVWYTLDAQGEFVEI